MVLGSGLTRAEDGTRYAQAVANLGGDHDAGVQAVRALRDGGAAAATTLNASWAGLSPTAKRRAVLALATLAKNHDAAATCLAEAAQSSDASLRSEALEALGQSGARGVDRLEGLLSIPVAASGAASMLARVNPDRAVPILLRWFDTEGAELPPEGRRALTEAVQRADTDVAHSFERWLADEPASLALAQAAVALSSVPTRQALQTVLIETGIAESNDFATDWHLMTASATAQPSDRIDGWLVTESRESEPWMLRAAAVDALAARQRDAALPDALEDPYPRVRLRAATVLAGDSETMTRRATMARRDVWPMVRAAALLSLRNEPAARPVIEAAVDDPMSEVRAAAVSALVDAPNDAGWERVHARLRNQNEWPSVVAACIAYVRVHCRRDAVEALYYVVKRAASPSALTDDVANAAQAVEALRALGTPDAEAIVAQLHAAETLPQPLETALKRRLSEPSACELASR